MRKVIKAVIHLSFIFYIFALINLLFLGSRGLLWTDMTLMEYIKMSSNFVPFRTIDLYITALVNGSLNMDIPIKNLFGNLIMFLPMGIYLPYYLKKTNNIIVFNLSMIISLFAIEAIQVVSRLGSFDIDDFILNIIGAFIGFGIWKAKVNSIEVFKQQGNH